MLRSVPSRANITPSIDNCVTVARLVIRGIVFWGVIFGLQLLEPRQQSCEHPGVSVG